MKWVLCTEDFPPGFIGGIASWANDLALALHNAGEHVTVLARQTGQTASFDRLQPFQIRRIQGRRWSKYKSLWMRLGTQSLTADVVLFSCWGLATKSAPYLYHRGISVGIAVHGSELTAKNIDTSSLLRLQQSVHCWFPVSHFLKSQLIKHIPQANIKVLPMPLPIANQPVQRDMQGPLICIARNTPYKGIAETKQLAQQLNKELWIIGSAPQQMFIPTTPLIKELGELPREKTRLFMQQGTAVILLSKTDQNGHYQEGLGLSLLEASAQGIPSIGSNCGGIPEALGPGFLWNSPSDTSHLRKWLNQPDIGKQAWHWIQGQHGPAHCLNTLMDGLS